MFKKQDELSQTAKRFAIRYSYLFQLLLLVALFVVCLIYGNLVLLPPLHLLNSSLYVSIILDKNIIILIITQLLVLFITQTIFNKNLGGPTHPLTSGTAGFRLMDERERTISDKSILITFLYNSIFLIIWGLIELLIHRNLGFPLIIIMLQFIFYFISRIIMLKRLGWEK